jgi:hypothetical protein
VRTRSAQLFEIRDIRRVHIVDRGIVPLRGIGLGIVGRIVLRVWRVGESGVQGVDELFNPKNAMCP